MQKILLSLLLTLSLQTVALSSSAQNMEPVYMLLGSQPTANGSIYKLMPQSHSIDALIEQANAEGKMGFKFLFDICFGPMNTCVDGPHAFYLNSPAEDAVYTFKAIPAVATIDEHLAQLNREGGDSFRYHMPLVYGRTTYNVYVKNSSRDTTYSYTHSPMGDSAAAFLDQVNQAGGDGRKLLTQWVEGATFYNIYIRDHSSTSTFAYLGRPPATSFQNLLDQANGLGDQGYRYLTDLYFTNLENQLIYVRENEKGSKFTYMTTEEKRPAESMVAHYNSLAQAGYRVRLSGIINGEERNFFVNLNQCYDTFCELLGAFTY